jgi:hypothetical protein
MGVLGANPKKEKRTMAKKKKKNRPAASAATRSKSAKRYAAKKKNPGVSLATLKSYLGKKKKGSGRKKAGRRNPAIFGVSGSEALASSAAVLGAVTVAKLALPLFPANWTASDLGRFGTTLLIGAVEVGAAHFFLPRYRTLVLAGAGAQALSVGLNPVLRKFSSNITLGRIQQQRSLRDFVPGNFPEPHNPIWQQMQTAGVQTGAVTMGGDRYRGRFQ